ncbi:MAG: CRTAC1 family protein [Vulcanimicrobiota bacterium]
MKFWTRDRLLGLVLVFTGALLSGPVVGLWVLDEPEVENRKVLWLIAALRLFLVVLGLLLCWRWRLPGQRQTALTVAFLLPLSGALYGRALIYSGIEATWRIPAAEALLLCDELEPDLQAAARALMELRLPTKLLGLRAQPQLFGPSLDTSVEQALGCSWQVIETMPGTEVRAFDPAAILGRLLDDVACFHNVRATFVDGRFLDPSEREWDGQARVSLELRTKDGRFRVVAGNLWFRYRREQAGNWRLVGLPRVALRQAETDQPWFEQATSQWVPSLETLGWSEQSPYEALILQADRSGSDVDVPMYLGLKRKPTIVAADIDLDGLDDLFVSRRTGGSFWLKNVGGGFRRGDQEAGLDLPEFYGACVFADLDNDGDRDLVLGGARSLLLLANEQGKFRPGSVLPALRDVSNIIPTDADRDGRLDLIVFSFSQPKCLLLHNLGQKFEVTGSNPTPFYALAGVCADMDGDGHQDLVVPALERSPLFYSTGAGGFNPLGGGVEQKLLNPRGASVADYDGDGRLDLLVTNTTLNRRAFAHAPYSTQCLRGNRLYRNTADGFRAVDGPWLEEVDYGSGGQFVDLNSDGRQDIFFPAGLYTAPGKSRGPLGRTRRGLEENHAFAQTEDGRFLSVSGLSGLNSVADGRGCAISDLDADGRPDLAVVSLNRPSLALYRNQTRGASWLSLRLQGGATPGDRRSWSNRDAVGAVLTVEQGKRRQTSQVTVGNGFGGQNSFVQTLALANGPVRLTVRWPSGRVQRFDQVAAGHHYDLSERTGRLEVRTLAASRPEERPLVLGHTDKPLQLWLLRAAAESPLPSLELVGPKNPRFEKVRFEQLCQKFGAAPATSALLGDDQGHLLAVFTHPPALSEILWHAPMGKP